MNATRIFRLGLLGGALAFCALAASISWHSTAIFHAMTPAGYDVLLIKPSNNVLTLLGLIECPELEGAQQIADGLNTKIINADGKPLEHFPRDLSFRITASLRKTVLTAPTDVYDIEEKPEDLLLKLQFRMKSYHALKVREIPPKSVQMIGVPADVPYDERIYRLTFNLADVPVTDRCVLEVLSPDGARLTRFHLDLL